VLLPPHKFARWPCWYCWSHDVVKCQDGKIFSDMTFIQRFTKTCQLVPILLIFECETGGGRTIIGFRRIRCRTEGRKRRDWITGRYETREWRTNGTERRRRRRRRKGRIRKLWIRRRRRKSVEKEDEKNDDENKRRTRRRKRWWTRRRKKPIGKRLRGDPLPRPNYRQ
jgi:hypothetical protein